MKRKLTTKQWLRRERVLDRRAAGRCGKWWDIGELALFISQTGVEVKQAPPVASLVEEG